MIWWPAESDIRDRATGEDKDWITSEQEEDSQIERFWVACSLRRSLLSRSVMLTSWLLVAAANKKHCRVMAQDVFAFYTLQQL